MKKAYTRAISVILLVTLLFSFPGVVRSEGPQPPGKAVPSPELRQQLARNEAAMKQAEETIKAIAPYIRFNSDGTVTLNLDDPTKVGLTDQELGRLKEHLEKLNSLAKQGEITIERSKGIPLDDQHRWNSNGFEVYWWGFRLALDHETTDTVIDYLELGEIGSIIAALLEVITGKVRLAIQAVLEIGAWGLERSDLGGGVYIYHIWCLIPVAGCQTWVQPQRE
jgi:hypothetical protein